jgi:hypothetical protein
MHVVDIIHQCHTFLAKNKYIKHHKTVVNVKSKKYAKKDIIVRLIKFI